MNYWGVFSGDTLIASSVRFTRSASIGAFTSSYTNRSWRKLKREGCRCRKLIFKEWEFRFLLEEFHWGVCMRQLDQAGILSHDPRNGERLSVSGRIGILLSRRAIK